MISSWLLVVWVSNVISHLPGAFVLSFARIISTKVLHLYELVQSVPCAWISRSRNL